MIKTFKPWCYFIRNLWIVCSQKCNAYSLLKINNVNHWLLSKEIKIILDGVAIPIYYLAVWAIHWDLSYAFGKRTKDQAAVSVICLHVIQWHAFYVPMSHQGANGNIITNSFFYSLQLPNALLEIRKNPLSLSSHLLI